MALTVSCFKMVNRNNNLRMCTHTNTHTYIHCTSVFCTQKLSTCTPKLPLKATGDVQNSPLLRTRQLCRRENILKYLCFKSEFKETKTHTVELNLLKGKKQQAQAPSDWVSQAHAHTRQQTGFPPPLVPLTPPCAHLCLPRSPFWTL